MVDGVLAGQLCSLDNSEQEESAASALVDLGTNARPSAGGSLPLLLFPDSSFFLEVFSLRCLIVLTDDDGKLLQILHGASALSSFDAGFVTTRLEPISPLTTGMHWPFSPSKSCHSPCFNRNQTETAPRWLTAKFPLLPRRPATILSWFTLSALLSSAYTTNSNFSHDAPSPYRSQKLS